MCFLSGCSNQERTTTLKKSNIQSAEAAYFLFLRKYFDDLTALLGYIMKAFQMSFRAFVSFRETSAIIERSGTFQK